MSEAEEAVIRRTIDGVEFEYEWAPETKTWHFHADGIVGGGQASLHQAIQGSREALEFSRERAEALNPAVAAMSDDLVEATAGLIDDVRRMLKLAQDPAWIHARGDMFDAWEAKDFPFIAAALKEE